MEKITKEKLIEMGGKLWKKEKMERVYLTAELFNGIYNTTLSDGSNKFFFDCHTKKMMRSYRGKRPKVEADYSLVEQGDDDYQI